MFRNLITKTFIPVVQKNSASQTISKQIFSNFSKTYLKPTSVSWLRSVSFERNYAKKVQQPLSESEDEDGPYDEEQESVAVVSQEAPDFSGKAVIDGKIKEISLTDYRGKYLVMLFYPLDWTFVCPTELIAFSDRIEEFRELNCEVVAASCDSEYSHLAWSQHPRDKGGLGGLNIPLLADITKDISGSYGVLTSGGFPLRGTHIIDESGIIKHITHNDPAVGRSVDETLRVIQAFQFADKHGQVCPANWKPGSDGIKPDVEKSKAYFQKHNK